MRKLPTLKTLRFKVQTIIKFLLTEILIQNLAVVRAILKTITTSVMVDFGPVVGRIPKPMIP